MCSTLSLFIHFNLWIHDRYNVYNWLSDCTVRFPGIPGLSVCHYSLGIQLDSCILRNGLDQSSLASIQYRQVKFLHFLYWCYGWYILYYIFRESKERILHQLNQNRTKNYREAQFLTVLLNDAFHYYLTGFVPGVICTTALLVFGTIRYYHVGFYSYIVFPVCGIRCFLDASTLFAMAGEMNRESGTFLKNWGKKIRSIQYQVQLKYESTFLKSSHQLSCAAGPLYILEQSILLVSLDHCAQLTFNLLVTYD